MGVHKLTIAKVLELALTCVCIGLHYHSFDGCIGNINTVMLTTGTFIGFSIILIGCAAGYLLQTPINRRIDLFFSLVGCAMFIASGALIIEAYHDGWKTDNRDKQLAKASFAIINGVVFFIDACLTFKD